MGDMVVAPLPIDVKLVEVTVTQIQNVSLDYHVVLTIARRTLIQDFPMMQTAALMVL